MNIANFKFTFTQFQEAAQRYDINVIESVQYENLSLQEFCPRIFACIREELTYYPELILHSLTRKENFTVRKLGAGPHYTTSDESFSVSKISNAEKKLFLSKILEPYTSRILECPQSKLARILGVFKLLPHKQYFVLMENMTPFSQDAIVFEVFNDEEQSAEDALGTVPHFTLNPLLKENLYRTMKKDLYFLRELEVVNYHFVMGVYDSSVGSIDSRYVFKADDGRVFTLSINNFFQSGPKQDVCPAVYYKRQVAFLKKFLNRSALT